jgi:WD40 repeat protein
MKPLCSVPILLLLVTQTALAQTTTVEVTIQAIKPEAKEITVEYGDGKSITLDVSRKAEIMLNGKEAALDSLGPGLTATIEYHKDLEVVTRIVATGKALGPPELIEVTEIRNPFSVCSSEDGLTIYFDRWKDEERIIYTAHRADSESLFEDEKALFDGIHPAVTNDGLEIIFVSPSEKNFYSATRETVGDSFRRPKIIPELQRPPEVPPERWSRCPRFSTDGLTIYFVRYPEGVVNEIAYATRPTRSTPWSPPQTLKVNNTLLSGMASPFVTDDGLTLLCTNTSADVWNTGKSNLFRFTRSSTDEPFNNLERVEEALFRGRYPQYIPATQELFFVQNDKGRGWLQADLIIVKGFVP